MWKATVVAGVVCLLLLLLCVSKVMSGPIVRLRMLLNTPFGRRVSSGDIEALNTTPHVAVTLSEREREREREFIRGVPRC